MFKVDYFLKLLYYNGELVIPTDVEALSVKLLVLLQKITAVLKKVRSGLSEIGPAPKRKNLIRRGAVTL